MVIKYGEDKSVTVKNYFAGGHSVKFINGTSIETLIANNVNEVYDFTNRCNVATITSNGGSDSLIFAGGLTYVHDVNNNDLVIKYGEDKSVTIQDYFDGGHSVKFINGTSAETLIADNVNEIYDFTNGCELDTIISNGGVDTLKFAENTEFVFEHDVANNDLVINYGNKSVTLKQYFEGNHSVIKINDSNISDLIENNLQEVICIKNGDTITYDNNCGVDTFVFGDEADLQYTEDLLNGNLTVENLNDNSKFIINGYFNGDYESLKIKSDENIQKLTTLVNASGRSIIGTNSADNINGTAYDDFITGGAGDDTIYDEEGNNTYIFNKGDGNDLIISGSGNDVVKFNEKMNLTYHYVPDYDNLKIKYSNSDSVSLTNYCFNYMHSVKKIINGDEEIEISSIIKDIVGITTTGNYGTNFNDTINNYIENKGPYNTIYAYDGNDYINVRDDKYGWQSDDIYAGSGDDIIIGNMDNVYPGKGNDTITESGPCRIYLYKGDGNDKLIFKEDDNLSYHYMIYFKDSDFNELSYGKSGKDLIISYNSGKDSITVDNLYANPNILLEIYNKNEQKQRIHELANLPLNYFYGENDVKNTINGTPLNDYIIGANCDDTIMGGAGNDTINGGAGNNTYIYNEGSGNDTIINGSGTDKIHFQTRRNLTFKHVLGDNSLVISYGDNDSIKLQDYFVNNSHSVKTIQNGANTVLTVSYEVTKGLTIIGTDGDDVVYSTLGNDTLSGGKGNDTYIFNTGDGNDVITNDSGNDTIQFQTEQELTFTHDLSNKDLVISYGNDDTITLEDFFVNNSHSVKYIQNGEEILTLSEEVAKGLTIIGTDREDAILGTAGNDIINGGAGDDLISGIEGNDTYIFNTGDGNDLITNDYGDDTIQFQAEQELSFTHNLSNNDLVISYGNDDTISLEDYFVNNSHSVDTIKNGEETLTLSAEIAKGMTIIGTEGNDVIYCTSGNDIINGGAGNDAIFAEDGNDIINGGAGNDSIFGGNGNDTIYGYEGKDNIEGGNGSDIIYGGDGDDTLRGLVGTDTIYGEGGNDFITGGNDNDTIYGGDGDDSIQGNGGDDLLDGGAGNDTFRYVIEPSGTDMIVNGIGNDTIRFDGATALSFSKNIDSNDLIITHDYGITKLHDFFVSNSHSVKTIDNADTILDLNTQLNNVGINIKGISECDNVVGTSFNDIVYAPQNGTVAGGEGANTYKVGFGYSNGNGYPTRTIISTSGLDIIHISDENFNGINTSYSYSKSNNDLIIRCSVSSSGGEQACNIIIKDYFINPVDIVIRDKNGDRNLYDTIKGKTFSGVKFGSGTYNSAYSTIIGSNGADNITSTSSSSTTIFGGKGNDTITGGSGNDTIYGGDGNDTLYGGAGDDYIQSNGGRDIIIGNEGNDDLYGGYGSRFIFNRGDGSDVIHTYSSEDILQFTGIALNTLTWTKSDADLIIGYNIIDDVVQDSVTIEDYFISEDKISNVIKDQYNNCTSLEEIISNLKIVGSETESNNITGTDYSDSIYGGQLNDTIYGGVGDDILYGEDGHDNISGGAGNDEIYGGDGDDGIYGNAGNDIINGGTGTNTFFFSEGDGNDTIINVGFIKSNYVKLIRVMELNEPVNPVLPIENYYYIVNDKYYFWDEEQNQYVYDSSKDKEFNLPIQDFAEFQAAIGPQLCIGENILYIKNYGQDNETYYKASDFIGSDEIQFETEQELSFTHNLSNNDLVISYGNDDTITLQDYFIVNSHSVKTIVNDNKPLTLSDEVAKGMTIIGTDGNDEIYSGYGDDIIYGGAGNDTITLTHGNKTVYGQDGHDIYIVQQLMNSSSSIYDNLGTNSIHFSSYFSEATWENVNSTYKDMLELYLNVYADGTCDDDLIIHRKGLSFDNSFLTVKNYMTDGKMNDIKSSDDYYVNDAILNNVIQQVASWLSTNNFDSVQQVLDSSNQVNIDYIISQFTTAWVK